MKEYEGEIVNIILNKDYNIILNINQMELLFEEDSGGRGIF